MTYFVLLSMGIKRRERERKGRKGEQNEKEKRGRSKILATSLVVITTTVAVDLSSGHRESERGCWICLCPIACRDQCYNALRSTTTDSWS